MGAELIYLGFFGDVDVAVDEAGEDEAVAAVDDFGAFG